MFWSGAATAAGPDAITGSAHDFSGDGWAQNQICIVCHSTHNQTIFQGAPLWNHEVTTGGTAGGTFTLYDNTRLGGTALDPAAGGAGEGISTLCLSCHDGSVALDSYGGSTGSTIINGGVAGGPNLTTDLSDDHPIAISFNTTDQPNMENPGVATTPLGGTIAADMLFGAGNRVECASCHDVHAETGVTNLLLFSNTGSALCQTCHLK
jgi:predicted CXXCH cytochrome family protein